MKKIGVILFMLCTTIFSQNTNKQELDLYYNAAVEKYVKSDYDKAIEYMEKVYNISPEQKYKNFIVKVLYEAANKSYMMQDYKKAYSYTQKAKKYVTDDEKINQLHNVLEDLLLKLEKENKSIKKESKEETKPIKKEIVQEQTKPVTEKKVVQKTSDTISHTVKNFSSENQNKNIPDDRLKKEIIFMKHVIFLEAVGFILIIIMLLFIKNKKLKTISNNYETKIDILKKENERLNEELKSIKIAVEKQKEMEEFYKKTLSNYQDELKQKNSTIEMLQKELVSLSAKQKEISYNIEDFMKQKHNEIVWYITKSPVQEEQQSEFDVEASRDRVAEMLKNLYELNSLKAMQYIMAMANNSNPMIRINIVQGLIEIATDETFQILEKLYNDPDDRVRREVIKCLWKLKQKIDNNEAILKENLKNMVIEIVQKEKRKGEWLF